MTTVALIGFSCSGKSDVGKAVRKVLPHVEIRDSDKEIARRLGDGSIASIFMRMEREGAVSTINEAEADFLDGIYPSASARLVVCGPNVILRDPQWSSFVARVQPIFYHLEITPEMCYKRLARRDEEYQAKYPGPRSGSWNAGILRDLNNGKWEKISRSEALARIPLLMQRQVAEYKRVADPARTYLCQSILKGKPDFTKLIASIVTDLNS